MEAKTTCTICPHACRLAEGQRGLCRARAAHNGVVAAENYGRITSLALDPIEKKPLARFRPGSTVLSVGSYGCNLTCPFCQNARIACAGQDDVLWQEMSPDKLVGQAHALRNEGCIGMAYTYNEPLVGYEFVLDCARTAHEAGLANVLVSNGYVNEGPLAELAPYIDAANIDLKGFAPAFYEAVGASQHEGCSGVETVKASIELLAHTPTCHVEITTLVVPGMNDSLAEIEAIATWIAALDPAIPLHLSRFFPCHHMAGAMPTPRARMNEAAEVASAHLHHVYLGNI